jgi:hypothetical protein
MLKKIAAYGAIAAGATAVLLSSAPAQAAAPLPAPAPAPGTAVSNPYAGSMYGYEAKDDPSGNYINIDKREKESNESNQLIYLCDVHLLGLDHLAQAKNEENLKCANNSFND